MTEPTGSATRSCDACRSEQNTDVNGDIAIHHSASGEPCPGGMKWTSAAPAAGLIGWGLGLLLAAALPFVLGFRGMVNASMYSDGDGSAWFVVSALMNIVGIIVLCMGTYRLARKADVAFLITQRRYMAAGEDDRELG
ncbi:hypothetical protein [uncultured Serinicoccus sp.]|uniref:hypothetical protein n=1 Tax=uncultured Serinicoccus sp. TaxID=735514 RepID=UPI002604FC24|nr:hypothetical protein [uncultured Serinicoccus sp.]